MKSMVTVGHPLPFFHNGSEDFEDRINSISGLNGPAAAQTIRSADGWGMDGPVFFAPVWGDSKAGIAYRKLAV